MMEKRDQAKGPIGDHKKHRDNYCHLVHIAQDHENKGDDYGYIETNFGRIVDGKGKKGRYIRMYSNGSTSSEMNHYIEVEVYAMPAK